MGFKIDNISDSDKVDAIYEGYASAFDNDEAIIPLCEKGCSYRTKQEVSCMKKMLVAGAALVLAAACVFTGCNGGNKTGSGKVLNIYCWNEEFQSRFNDYYAAKNPAALNGVTVNWVITPNEGNAYQNKLDEVLLQQKSAKADDKVDIFLVEADYALKYVDTAYTLDVKKDIGLTDADLANQYKYTQDIMTDSKGVLKGVSWQSCPAGMIYRRSIAKAVFGTDDPESIQALVSDWTKFNTVASQLAAKGYKAVSGFDDTYRVFNDNVTSPWVSGNKIVIDPAMKQWVAQTKEFTDKGYNNKTSLWDDAWNNGMMADAKVFAYFGPGWLIDFCMHVDDPASAAAAGDWAFIKGPQGFSWGGTWVCGAAGSDNIDLIKDIMYTLTCDSANMQTLASETGDFANNTKAMTALANGSYSSKVLGGQNPYGNMLAGVQTIDKSNISAYDQGMNEKFQAAMKEYFNGNVTEEAAYENFYTSVLELYPNLSR
jgi:hypothetical protein